ncbi:MAG: organomercurial lyase [Acidimicrobiia bacterium]
MSDAGDHQSGCRIDGDLLRGELNETGLELAAAGFAALWHGRPVLPTELLPDRASLLGDITALVQHGRAEIDPDGRLVGIHGLTLRTTRHRFVHDGSAHHTWCAFDSIGIPAALRLDATAHTDCPACQRRITVDIVGGVPDDSAFALWLPASADGNLIANFCAHADLYCSREHLGRNIDTARTSGDIADLAAAVSLGCDVWADVASVTLDEASS